MANDVSGCELGHALSELEMASPRQGSDLRNVIFEYANPLNLNLNYVALRQCEVVRRDDARPGHQKYALRKAAIAKKKPGQFLGIAFEFGQRRAPHEYPLAGSRDFHLNRSRIGKRLV